MLTIPETLTVQDRGVLTTALVATMILSDL